MNIEIHQPKLEALIQQRMASGHFNSVEDLLMRSLEATSLPSESQPEKPKRTGLDLLKVMQAMPHKDIDIEPARYPMPVRDIDL